MCNGNGRCTLGNNGWYCVCQLGWRGTGCDTSMETACSDVKDNDGGKITNSTQLCLLTSINRDRLLTRLDLTVELTTFVREDILYLLRALQAQWYPRAGEDEEWFPVSHLDNRFLLKSSGSWPEASRMHWPQEEVPALPSN